MAFNILPSQPPVQGLGLIGQQVLQAGQEYNRLGQQRQAEDRARAFQVSEREARNQEQVQAEDRARAFATGQNRIQFDQQQEASDLAMKRGLLTALIGKGYLREDQIQDADAVKLAYANAQRDGVVQRYQQLIDGGYLTAEDAADPTKVMAAMDAIGKQSSSMRTNATAESTQLATDIDGLNQQADAIQKRLVEPMQPPSDTQILQHAKELAQAAHPDLVPAKISRQMVAEMVPQSTKELRDVTLQNEMVEKGQLRTALDGIRFQLSDKTQQLHFNQQQFRVAPGPHKAPPAAAPVTAPATSKFDPEQAGKVMASVMNPQGAGPQVAPGQSIPAELQPLPGDAPEIQAENARRAARFQDVTFNQPVQEAQKQLGTIDTQIAALRQQASQPALSGGSAVSVPFGRFQMQGNPAASGSISPSEVAQRLSALLTQRDQLAKTIAQSQQRVAPLAPAPMTPMAPTMSAPRSVSDTVYSTNPTLQRFNDPYAQTY